MCFGIPMKILEVNGLNARCEARGTEREVSLMLMQDALPEPGSHVVVNLGYALSQITSQEAESAWEIYDQMLQL